MSKLLLIDGSNYLFRAYHALPPLTTSRGEPSGAIKGFLGMLANVARLSKADRAAVIFDAPGKTFRHEMYPAYKANRPPMPEDLRTQIEPLQGIVRALGWPLLIVPGIEADDVIGTLATEAGKRGITTYMMTPDKDYGQLVGENVFMYRPRHNDKAFEVMGVEEVKNKYAIQSPLQVIDLLGLMGDASDNIPGCPGVGEKTAQKLIAQFGNIENLLAHTDQLKGALRTKVEENRKQIEFSRFLATIKTDVPLPLDMDALKRESPDEEELRKIFQELEFRTLLERIFKEKPKETPAATPGQGDLFGFFTPETTSEPEKTNLATLHTLNCNYQLVDNEEKLSQLLQNIVTQSVLSLDTETTSTDPIRAELVGMSFSYAENQAFYVPVPADRSEAQKIVDRFRPVFENREIMKVCLNRGASTDIFMRVSLHIRSESQGA